MNILEKIVAHKREEIADRKALFPTKLLEKSIYFPTTPLSLKKYLLRDDKHGIIAEFKRSSPSQGAINMHAPVERTSIGYMQAGASALSVLTDKQFFSGSNEDLSTARRFNFCPILRKDFVIDEYQILEAKSIGADAVLLIAAILAPDMVSQLAAFARSLGLEVLLEVHDRKELDQNLEASIDLLGVNNRDLKSFEVDIQTSIDLAPAIPEQWVKISESGISDPEAIIKLDAVGYKGYLIGQTFMQESRPEHACSAFIERLHGARQTISANI